MKLKGGRQAASPIYFAPFSRWMVPCLIIQRLSTLWPFHHRTMVHSLAQTNLSIYIQIRCIIHTIFRSITVISSSLTVWKGNNGGTRVFSLTIWRFMFPSINLSWVFPAQWVISYEWPISFVKKVSVAQGFGINFVKVQILQFQTLSSCFAQWTQWLFFFCRCNARFDASSRVIDFASMAASAICNIVIEILDILRIKHF